MSLQEEGEPLAPVLPVLPIKVFSIVFDAKCMANRTFHVRSKTIIIVCSMLVQNRIDAPQRHNSIGKSVFDPIMPTVVHHKLRRQFRRLLSQ
jgi:hypothetical protein